MKPTNARRSTIRLTAEQQKQLRKDRALIAAELPALIAKHKRLCEAAQDFTHSGVLRRAIHASKILLDDLAQRVGTDLGTLDAFLVGNGTLTSDVIDHLTTVLQLRLAPANGKPRARRAKAG